MQLTRTFLTSGMLLSATLWLLPAHAATVLTPPHKIDEVVVYPDRAMVTRVAHLKLQPGTYQVVVAGLPLGLQADSVRAGGSGSAKVMLHGLEVDSVPVGKAPSQLLEQAEKRRDGLAAKDRELLDTYKINERQLKLLTDMVASSSHALVNQLANSKAKLTEWGDTLTFLKARQGEASRAMHEAELSRQKLAVERQKVEAELAKLRAYKQAQAYQVPVTLEVQRAGEFDLRLSYLVPGTTWHPTHEARLDADGKRLHWTTLGTVSQRTGEDWHDVSLKLSTARPSEGSSAPELSAWWLSFYQAAQPPAPSSRAMSGTLGGYDRMEDVVDADQKREMAGEEVAEIVSATIQDQGTSMVFAIPRRVDIPSDGRAHQAPVGSFEADAQGSYKAVPRLTAAAFLDLELPNKALWPLLAGEVKSFVGNNLVGKSRLKETVSPQEKFTIGMGVDEAVHVERERLERKSGERGVLGRVNYLSYRFRITVTNAKDVAQKVHLFEPLPRANQDQIKVTLDQISLKPKEEPGRLSWELDLAPGQKQVLEWGYTVEYPLGASIAGLE